MSLPCRSGYYQLRQLRPVVRFLSADGAKEVVHAFILSRLDYCNLLLTGTANCLLRWLQSLQNMAAHLGAPRREHITPILRQLHWLPVRQRVPYKLATLALWSLSGQAPVYLTDDCQLVAESGRRTLRSAERSFCIIQCCMQQHLWRQIICSSWSACLERPSCYPSQHQADNGHFLPSANISKLFGLLIHEVVAHSWHSDFTAPFINVRTYLDGISVV